MTKAIRVMLAVLVAPVLAACAAISSLSTILADTLPQRSVALPIVDANAYTNLSLQLLTGGAPPGNESAQTAAFEAGRRTFNAEPTNSNAISLMAVGQGVQGDRSVQRQIYADALLVSKRNRLANLWLLEDASQTGRIGYILDRYDVLLRTGGAASDLLFGVLGTALREEAILPHLESRLARRPPWAEQFWLKVTPNKGAIANVGLLRLRLLERGVENPAANDADIVMRLVGNGDFDVAHRLVSRLAAKDGHKAGQTRDAEFAKVPRFPPFDWESFSGSGYGAQVDPQASAIAIYSEQGVDTLMARQLLVLEPGRYRLAYQVKNPEALGAYRTAIRTSCAEPGETRSIGALSLTSASGQTLVSVPGAQCRYVWLEVWTRKEAERTDQADDLLIDRIEVRRLP